MNERRIGIDWNDTGTWFFAITEKKTGRIVEDVGPFDSYVQLQADTKWLFSSIRYEKADVKVYRKIELW